MIWLIGSLVFAWSSWQHYKAGNGRDFQVAASTAVLWMLCGLLSTWTCLNSWIEGLK